MDREALEKILACGARAPSADNLQPWKINIREDLSIEVTPINPSPNDHKYFSYKDRLTQIAIGAFLKNIEIASRYYGYTPVFHTKKWEAGRPYVEVAFEKDSEKAQVDIFEAIKKRATLRVPYKTTVSADMVANLSRFSDALIFTDRNIIENLATCAVLNERLVLETQELHTTFKSHITWSSAEQKKKKSGLFINTLGLNPVQKVAFQSIRSWQVLSFLNKIGFSKLIAKENSAMYKCSAGMGMVTVENYSPDSVVKAGMTFQEIWLYLVSRNVWLQPITGITFLHQMVKENEIEWLPVSKRAEVEGVVEYVDSLLPQGTYPLILFRFGESDKKPVYTERKEIS